MDATVAGTMDSGGDILQVDGWMEVEEGDWKSFVVA